MCCIYLCNALNPNFESNASNLILIDFRFRLRLFSLCQRRCVNSLRPSKLARTPSLAGKKPSTRLLPV